MNQSSGSSPDIPGYVAPEQQDPGNKYDDLGRIVHDASKPGGMGYGYSSPPAMKYGGNVRLPEPAIVVGAWTGKPYAIAAEAGMKEDVRATPRGLKFTPTNEPIRKFASGGSVEQAESHFPGEIAVPEYDYTGRGSDPQLSFDASSAPAAPPAPNLGNDSIRVDRAPTMPNGVPQLNLGPLSAPQPSAKEQADTKAAADAAAKARRVTALKALTKYYFPWGGWNGSYGETDGREQWYGGFTDDMIEKYYATGFTELPEGPQAKLWREIREQAVPAS